MKTSLKRSWAVAAPGHKAAGVDPSAGMGSDLAITKTASSSTRRPGGGSRGVAESSTSSNFKFAARVALLGAAYYVTAVLSLKLALVGRQVTPIWPPTGIAVVGLLLFGRRMWPGIAAAALLVNAPISHSLLFAAGIAAGNTLAPIVAVTLLRRVNFRPEIDRLRDAVAVVVLGALFAMTVSATAGTLSVVLSHSVALRSFWPTWWVWWAGDAMGVLVVAPFLLSLRGFKLGTYFRWHRIAEGAMLFVGLAIVGHFVFQTPLRVEYIVFPFLVWAVLRFGQRGAAPAALLTSAIAIWAAVQGTGPFARGTLVEKMVTLQVFNASVALASFVLAAIAAERLHERTERARSEEQLAHLALQDPLTGLANRVFFMEQLRQALARTERRGGLVGVLFLDLDRFKSVNDCFGHEVGDRVLVRMAERLRHTLRPGDTAARFGGDEFVVLCEDLEDECDAIRVAERVARAVGEPVDLDASDVVVTTSVGIALATGATDGPEVLLRHADAALYRAKERGKARCELFDDDMRIRAQARLHTERELRRALAFGEFRLHYQPLVLLTGGRIESVEALVRWDHPQRGILLPDDFVPLAEETGLIRGLGIWVLRESCMQAVRWAAAAPDRPFRVAVNLSPRQLARREFEADVAAVFAETGVNPNNLAFEITETMLIDKDGPTVAVLLRLKELGVRLLIDDFGTGYSSLGYLKRFQVDGLKVDRSFVQSLGTDPKDSSIVASVVNLAHGLGLSAVAEGVETAQQLAELRRLGCDLAQGYFFSPPRPAEAIDDLLRLEAALASA
jgi:diguanylate cyclase (GGDEF)-like protein